MEKVAAENPLEVVRKKAQEFLRALRFSEGETGIFLLESNDEKRMDDFVEKIEEGGQMLRN